MQLCFFEDDQWNHFNPLTLTRPTDDLRTGILTIGKKWQTELENKKWTRCLRPELNKVFQNGTIDKHKDCLWINSRFLPSKKLLKEIERLKTGCLIKTEGSVAAAKVSGQTASKWLKAGKPDFNACKTVQTGSFRCINHLWDLFLMNKDEITADLERLDRNPEHVMVSDQAILQNKDKIYTDESAAIKAGALLTAEEGPIYIGPNAVIDVGSIVEGPAAICRNAIIKPGAKIHANTTVGPVCKAGGEIANSILHSYSNKGHDGYMGHSLIGQWCNLGAGTNISNLKNNYSNVRIRDWRTEKMKETSQQFLGTIMGDHTKTAIGTRLNTGTICGVSCNIFSTDFPSKYLPSFSWVSSNEILPYNLEKALKAMRAMMARRNKELTADYEKLMRTIFDES